MPRQGSLSGRRSWAGTPWPGSEVKIWEGLPWGWGRGQKLLDSGYYGYASYRDCPHGGVHTLAQLTQGSSGWVTCPPGPPKVGVGGHGSCMCTLAGDMTFVPEPGTGIGVSELPFTPHPRHGACSWTGLPVSLWASFPAFFLCTSAVLGVLEAISVCALTSPGLLSLHPHPSPQLVFLCPFVLEVSGPCSQYGWDGGEGGPGVTAPFHSLRCETHASLFFFMPV